MLAMTSGLMGQDKRRRQKTEQKAYTQDAIHRILLVSMDTRAAATRIGRRSSTSRSIVRWAISYLVRQCSLKRVYACYSSLAPLTRVGGLKNTLTAGDRAGGYRQHPGF